MRTKLFMIAIAGSVGLVLLTGCFSLPWTRTGNQGGSTRVGALLKLAQGDLSTLNPDDVQVITDAVIDIGGLPIDPISDGLAQAFVDTLAANNVSSLADLQRVAQALAANPNSLVIPADAEQYRPEIEQIIEQLSDPAVRQQLQESFSGASIGDWIG